MEQSDFVNKNKNGDQESRFALLVAKQILPLGRRSGWLFVSLYLKQCAVALMVYRGSDAPTRRSELSVPVRLTRSGFVISAAGLGSGCRPAISTLWSDGPGPGAGVGTSLTFSGSYSKLAPALPFSVLPPNPPVLPRLLAQPSLAHAFVLPVVIESRVECTLNILWIFESDPFLMQDIVGFVSHGRFFVFASLHDSLHSAISLIPSLLLLGIEVLDIS
ncbi:Uncharacterized mitochondrial protein AtMg00050 [Striga hermonthica]|uniref:Uncharacterized mitochondrial protein AtMg00050 n=1 Tax=Striga hermonthica TaxID=68872 RepID=A0A9N7MZA3_STRHE|nr:Uncharacterized mitochondrial protein AtMg00050 [Striga hermonthica]